MSAAERLTDVNGICMFTSALADSLVRGNAVGAGALILVSFVF